MYDHGVVDNSSLTVKIPYGYAVDFYSGKNFDGKKYSIPGWFYTDQTLLT